ncbi:MAG TPA: methionyl-tRNA formyltransferase, partial [Anaerolineales bacterium]|nr:methionyl-tRNA formyltransferase [Anaerolineales bacterium]
VQAAILNGDETSGVTIMKMDPGVDTGPILSQRAIAQTPGETGGSLTARLADLGAALLIETLPAYLQAEILPQPQDENQATYAPLIKKVDGRLDFNLTAEQLTRRVRAFNPWPGAYMTWHGDLLKIHRAHAAQTNGMYAAGHHAAPGQRRVYAGLPAVITTHGLLVLDEVQPAGKRPQPGESFLRGARAWA